MSNEDRKTDANATHEGFSITCDECGSSVVMVTSDIGYSELSGEWGGVHLKCCDCHKETTIYGY